MQRWLMFVVGTAVLIAVISLPFYERFLAACGAIALLIAIIYGFLLQPRTEVFHVRTTTPIFDPDGSLIHEHELIAVKVEVARLWLLFLPTFMAITFLVVTSAHGTTWKFNVLERIFYLSEHGGYLNFWLGRAFLFAVTGMLAAWITERRVLRNATATSAMSIDHLGNGRVTYVCFNTDKSYYGGECFYFGLVRPSALARLVFYNETRPDMSKLAAGFLFQSPFVVANGLTDFDKQTVNSRTGTVREEMA